MESKQEFLPAAQPVAAFDEFRSQLNELQVGNSKAVFDYRDPKGNKEARSHVAKLRTTKAAIEKKRVAEKEEFLVKGRLVDADAKYLTAVVQSMIEVHENPLKEIENEERQRVEAIKQRIESLSTYKVYGSSGEKKLYIDELKSVKAFVIDESLGEFQLDAAKAKESAIVYLEQYIIGCEKHEAEQAELARLRAEAVLREQKDREERIAREAADNARIAAEKAAEHERQRLVDEQLRKDREAQAEIDKANREKLEAENARLRQQQEANAAIAKAKQDAIDAAARAEQHRLQSIADTEARITREAAVAQAIAEKQAANKANQKRKNNDVLAFLMAHHNMTEEGAKALIKDIALSNVPWISINY